MWSADAHILATGGLEKPSELRHSSESWNPVPLRFSGWSHWILAFAGMTSSKRGYSRLLHGAAVHQKGNRSQTSFASVSARPI